MNYVMADIHGDYEKYMMMLRKLRFGSADTLYVLGDVIDRGKGGIKILQDMMCRDNVIPIIGNHEYMALSCMKVLIKEITNETLSDFSAEFQQGLLEWLNVGGMVTVDEFKKLSAEDRAIVVSYIEEFRLYEEVTLLDGREFVLVHAGIENFDVKKPISEYHLSELIFSHPRYEEVYYPDKYLVTGHFPTRNIEDNKYMDSIYRLNNHIAIDCGCGFGGRLGAICLETGEEFYV